MSSHESKNAIRRIEIMVKGQVDRGWSDWFGGFEIIHSAGGSTLIGPVRDQAELRGILFRLADLGLELISVNPLSELPVPKGPAKGVGRHRRKEQ